MMLSTEAKRKALFAAGFAAGLVVICGLVLFVWLARVVVGVETRTSNPTEQQVSYSRDFLHIHPELEIVPLAYYVKAGMDHQVRFKFVAMTDDPARLFDAAHIDAGKFQADFVFPPGEKSHNEAWWDINAHPLAGGHVLFPKDGGVAWRMSVGYTANSPGKLTVYVWHYEVPASFVE